MSKKKYCSYCDQETSYEVIGEYKRWHPAEIGIKKDKVSLAETKFVIEGIEETVCKCLGCERHHIHYRVRRLVSLDPPNTKDTNSFQLPEKIVRSQPSWYKNLHIDYFSLLGEIYDSFNRGNLISFSICARTLIDTILTDKMGDVGGFQKKLSLFQKSGAITPTQLKTLDLLVKCGHASAHRAFRPTDEIASLVLDIVEQILHEDVLKKQVDEQIQEIPERK